MPKKRPVMRRRIKLNKLEKLNLFLWSALSVFLVGVFVYMTWYMYNPESRMAHNLKYGRRYLVQADYSKAVAEFRRVLAMDENNAEAYKGLMEVALKSEDTDAALSLYGRAESVLSSYKEPLISLLELRAVERLDNGDYDGALSVAVTVEAATGDSNEAALIRALVIDGMLADARDMEPEDALELYRRLLKIDGIDAPMIYTLMAEVCTNKGDPNGALAVIDEGISATGSDTLTKLRADYIRKFAAIFLPDTFVKNINDYMAAGDFISAAAVVRHELFLYRVADYVGEADEFGEAVFDFTAIQPADMNTTMYAEYNSAGQLLMIIIDWERTTEREAVFNELVYVPAGDIMLALSQKQSVTESNTLSDEGHYWRVGAEALSEISSDEYFDSLSGMFTQQFDTQLQDEEFAFDFNAYLTDPESIDADIGADGFTVGGYDTSGAAESSSLFDAEQDTGADGAMRTGEGSVL